MINYEGFWWLLILYHHFFYRQWFQPVVAFSATAAYQKACTACDRCAWTAFPFTITSASCFYRPRNQDFCAASCRTTAFRHQNVFATTSRCGCTRLFFHLRGACWTLDHEKNDPCGKACWSDGRVNSFFSHAEAGSQNTNRNNGWTSFLVGRTPEPQ